MYLGAKRHYINNLPFLFTARRNARIASAVLATAIPSVSPSVRLSHAAIVSKRRHVYSTVQFALPDSKMCLVL